MQVKNLNSNIIQPNSTKWKSSKANQVCRNQPNKGHALFPKGDNHIKISKRNMALCIFSGWWGFNFVENFSDSFFKSIFYQNVLKTLWPLEMNLLNNHRVILNQSHEAIFDKVNSNLYRDGPRICTSFWCNTYKKHPCADEGPHLSVTAKKV